MPFELVVNGQARRVEAPADKPLLWVLREDLGLTGTKFGYGVAACVVGTVDLGNAVVAVADSYWRANRALDALDIVFEGGSTVTDAQLFAAYEKAVVDGTGLHTFEGVADKAKLPVAGAGARKASRWRNRSVPSSPKWSKCRAIRSPICASSTSGRRSIAAWPSIRAT